MKPMKKQKRGLAIFTICLMVGMGLVFFGSTGTASAAEVFKARYSYHWFPAHHLAVYSEKFAQLAKEETKGRIILLPTREDITMPIQEHLIVELYSK